jgi:hypothetical protein
MESDLALKNEKQIYYNQVKGVVTEINEEQEYCSITLDVGHENIRKLNLSMKRIQFDSLCKGLSLGQKILAKFYVVSRKKTGRWYTSANILDLELVD